MSGETTLTVIGNLTADPIIRYMNDTGDAVVNFTVAATPRVFDRKSNQWKDGAALFMRCTLWREAAEHVANSLTKGARVMVLGKLQQRDYTDRDGNKRTVMELVADEVGVSLKYAVAKPVRQSNNRKGGQPAGNPGAASATSEDPWMDHQPASDEVA